jgi:hypothetical protein
MICFGVSDVVVVSTLAPTHGYFVVLHFTLSLFARFSLSGKHFLAVNQAASMQETTAPPMDISRYGLIARSLYGK